MTDTRATPHRPVDKLSGQIAMSQLADRLLAMTPPPLDLSPALIVRPSPAVAAALATSSAAIERYDLVLEHKLQA